MRTTPVYERLVRPAAAVLALVCSGVIGTSARAAESVTETWNGRQMIVYAPAKLPALGFRAMVVVLHGGLGNAQRIADKQSESGLNMDAVADEYGFIVAYLNGTPVTRIFGTKALGWNAGGGCCGLSAENNVDDVGYIKGAVEHLVSEYGVDRSRVFGMGHSNGAMMTQRLMCETTLFAAAIAISGPLNSDASACPSARGRRVLAIHGAEDENVPIAGGPGTKGLSKTAYKSEARSKQVLSDSGATYTLQIVAVADHTLDHIDAAIQKTEGESIAEKSAAFFGLAKP